MREFIDKVALYEKRETYPLRKGQEIDVYRNPSPREIMRVLKASQAQTLRGGMITDFMVWDAHDASHGDIGNVGYNVLIADSVERLEHECDWGCAGTIYKAGIGCYVLGVSDFAESIADRFDGLTKIGMLLIKIDKSHVVSLNDER